MDAQVLVIPHIQSLLYVPIFTYSSMGDLEYKLAGKFGHMFPHMDWELRYFGVDQFKTRVSRWAHLYKYSESYFKLMLFSDICE